MRIVIRNDGGNLIHARYRNVTELADAMREMADRLQRQGFQTVHRDITERKVDSDFYDSWISYGENEPEDDIDEENELMDESETPPQTKAP